MRGRIFNSQSLILRVKREYIHRVFVQHANVQVHVSSEERGPRSWTRCVCGGGTEPSPGSIPLVISLELHSSVDEHMRGGEGDDNN